MPRSRLLNLFLQLKKKVKIPWEMVYSRAGAENTQGEPGASCSVGK